MNEGHKQLRKLIKAYARLMNTEKEFSKQLIDQERLRRLLRRRAD